ncbi:MAG TPA: heme peroxidase family protein [Gemmatirosa sp.]
MSDSHRLPPGDAKRGPSHGGGIRGADLSRRSPQFEGRCGRMFRALPAAEFPEAELDALARAMTADPEADRGPDGRFVIDPATGFIDARATPETEIDDEENFGIPAGYTYLGQFIDHDLTFDPASSLVRQNDPDGLVDFRTPRFDLDNVYGRGPDDEPFMYDPAGRRFVFGAQMTEGDAGHPSDTHDLPRFNGRALIGDKRNDENVIVSQLQGLFLRFHNRVASLRPVRTPFAELQRVVRWHYQWVILHDFLPRLVGAAQLHAVLPHLASGRTIFDDPPRLDFYEPREAPYIPIEFTAAAYRFGHSMVRPIYRLNPVLGTGPTAGTPHDVAMGRDGRQFIFSGVGARSLTGFGPFPPNWAIDWNLFFEVDATLTPAHDQAQGRRRVQPSYKLDTSLVNPLGFLPEFSSFAPGGRNLIPDANGNPKPARGADVVPNLARRNLLRGLRMGLPSGQAVARAMGLRPLDDVEIRIGKATWHDAVHTTTNRPITEYGRAFAGNAPLWTYVLAEAQHAWLEQARGRGEAEANAIPVRLGPVGGRIVTEVFVGLLLGDSHSFLAQDPGWQPEFRDAHGRFDMPEFVRVARAYRPTQTPADRPAAPEPVRVPDGTTVHPRADPRGARVG